MTEQLNAQGDSLFRALLESAPDAMVIVNQDGTILLVNAQAVRMFGYARAEMLGKPVELLVPQRYRERHARHRGVYAGAAHPRGMGAGLDLFGQRKDGSEFPVEISLSPLQTEQGLLVASAIRDISDRRAAELERDRLLQERAAHAEASRVKDEFIATLSHELRTPLNAILGWASLLHDGAVPPGRIQGALATIIRNARAQIHLVEDLLDVSRIVAGKLKLQPRAIDFAEVVSDALQVVRPSADAKSITIDAVFETRPLILIGDPDRLQQAVWNVLSNAVKFSDVGGRVEARAWTGTSTTYFTVRDTGAGIDPQFLPHVFDRFRQADSAYTREHGGLGLGLAIVRSIVELHGGTVKMSSSGRGYGATVLIELPSRAAEPTRGEALLDIEGGRPDLTTERILVVDDQPDERELLSTILSGLGISVRTAGSVHEALIRLEEWRPTLLMTDIAMPIADGYVLLRRVRELGRFASVPAIAVTAHARIEDRERAEAAGFQAYLSKPIDRDRLVRVLTDVIQRSNAGTGQRSGVRRPGAESL